MSGYYKFTCDLEGWDSAFVKKYSKHKLIWLDSFIDQLYLKFDGSLYRQINDNDFFFMESKLPHMDVCQFRISWGAGIEFVGALEDAAHVWENL